LKLASRKPKRWDGKVDALPVDYLKGMLDKMQDYGDQVQFSLLSGPLPNYQLINSFEKKMAFDCNHHLLRSHEEDFSAANATSFFSKDQVEAMIRGVRMTGGEKAKAVRAVRTGGTATRTTVRQLEDQFAAERYEYFRTHRATLPPAIAEHSAEIIALMKQGKSAEEAFSAVIEKYYRA
jgi:hypothetical protein